MIYVDRHDDQPVLITSVSNTHEWTDGPDCAVIRPTVKTVAYWLTLIDLANVIRKGNVGFSALEYWNSDPEYYPSDNDAREQFPPWFDGDGDALTPKWDYDDAARDMRTEGDRLVVYTDGIKWRGYVKHTDVEIQTEEISRAFLVELLADLEGAEEVTK